MPNFEKQTHHKFQAQKTSRTQTQEDNLGKTFSSWSRQQHFAMIASFTILALLLIAAACSKQSEKPVSDGVGSALPLISTMSTAPAPNAIALLASVSSSVPMKKKSRKRSATVTYTDVNTGLSFVYPRKAMLNSGDPYQSELGAVGDVPMNFVQPGGVLVATVALPSNSYPGTDFVSAFFNVSVNRSISEQECSNFASIDSRNADSEAVDAERVKVGTTVVPMTSNFSGSAVKQVETQYFHNFVGGACYEYVLGLNTEGFATERGIKHVDRDAVFTRLEKILATVKTNAKINRVESEHGGEIAGGIASGKE